MDLISNYIDPTRLTGMIRTALFDLQVNQHKLARWLPNVNLDDVKYEFDKGQQGLPEAAVYRAFDAESPIGRREGISQVMGSLPPISEKMVLNEYERLRLRRLNDDALLPFVARDAQRLARNIGARLELARGDAIFNAQVTIDENGVKQTVSYGRASSHSNAVAGTLWSDHADSTPIDDMISWAQTYSDDNGDEAGVILMPKAVFFHLQQNAQIKGRTWPTAATADASLPTASVQQVNDTLTGMGLPRIELYDAKVKVDGSATRITPANKIALLPPPGNPQGNSATDLGATFLGTTAESLEPEYGLLGQEAGVVGAQFKTKDPVRVWTHAAAIALPVLTAPDLTFVAQVV